MSNMNNNDRGRITGMPGTETTVKLYPQRLGVRMRNSTIRMLENRALTGGWSSKSRQIAQALAVKNGLQLSVCHWGAIYVLGLSATAAPLIREIVHADWTAWLLENSSYRVAYYRDKHDQALAHIDAVDQDFYVNMYDKDSIRKVVEILADHTSQELKDKAKQVANLLRGTEPIEIITFKE
jgi:sulfur relay (sulfurtransferase) DsrC/TusE family protein